MGAKVPVRTKTRRPTCKCDICGCSFLSIQALRTHQACLHPKTKRVAYKPKVEVIARRKAPLKKSNLLRSTKLVKRVKQVKEKVPEAKTDKKETINVKRSGFECPLCSKSFTVYFSAYRHIQNNHCVNDKGEVVSPNSSSLIKPLTIEQCIHCNAKLGPEKHICKEVLTNNDECSTVSNQTCLGCNAEFKSAQEFETHIREKHSEDAEYFFFADNTKFSTWKRNAENQMDSNYLVMKDKDNCQVYHCNHFSSNKTTVMACPSSICTQVFNKGIQVVFYKKHYGHTVKDYILPELFKKFLITPFMRNAEAYNEMSDNSNDVYLEFKRLMENIILEGAKVNESSFKLLLGKAFEMTVFVNSHRGDNEKHNAQTNKKMTDEEISKFFDEPQQTKRKLAHNETNAKRLKTEAVAKIVPRIISKDEDMENSLLSTEEESCSKILITDVKSLKNEEDELNLMKSKTQMQQSLSETYNTINDVNLGTPMVKSRTRRKDVMKTRIGQFKPNVVSTPKKSPVHFNYRLPKADIQYEVLERENDCNILIIKI